MIASVAFKNFKVLRRADLKLQPFNLVIGPNGSGKTSLIQALQRLRTLSQLSDGTAPSSEAQAEMAQIAFRFDPPYENLSAELSCVSDVQCDALAVEPEKAANWPGLQKQLSQIRAYLFDHRSMASPCEKKEAARLSSDGGNLAAVLQRMSEVAPKAFEELVDELIRIMPEFSELSFQEVSDSQVDVALSLKDGSGTVLAADLSQGTLYLLGMLVLAYDPAPPAMVCIEEIDRGIHPRMLREVRDLLYRLSYPEDKERRPVQVIATTHSPYLLDLFRDHPEEVVISQKEGNAARFECLADRDDLEQIMTDGSLGDIWFSGILGGVPEER